MSKDKYNYSDNMHIIDEVLERLLMTRTIEEEHEFKRARQITFLKMFPCVNPQADIIEEMFDEYCKEHTVEDWYNNMFTGGEIKKITI